MSTVAAENQQSCDLCQRSILLDTDDYSVTWSATSFATPVSGAPFQLARSDPKTYTCMPCAKKRRLREYKATGVLTSALCLDASLASTSPSGPTAMAMLAEGVDPTTIVFLMEEVEDAKRRWQREVWFGGIEPDKDDTLTESDRFGFRVWRDKKTGPRGLQRFVLDAAYKGYEAEVNGTKYMSYTIAGRSLFQIEQGSTLVCIILDEDSPSGRGGIQGIHAKPFEAAALIDKAIDDWTAGRIRLEHHNAVHILGT